MGQAKNRGTREQRVQRALERNGRERQERERQEIEAAKRRREQLAAMTPEQRAQAEADSRRLSKNQLMLASILALAGTTCP